MTFQRSWVRFTTEPGRETGSGFTRSARMVDVDPSRVVAVEDDGRGDRCVLHFDAGATVMVFCQRERALKKLGVLHVSG